VQPDGSRLLAIEGLQTTNGPDVHVWLSAADVVEGLDGWYTAGSAERVDLGPIKGNQGDQVYPIPDDVDLDRFPAVDLWCVQFGVSFGAAQLSTL
ncbi:DM13 domain-containing protein, partial [Arthrobacter sp. Ld5]|uniref:DM13 domain-containing protein n=1 Tax=Arthrobacter sp. Ld5 TaxID=649152 RepID=UPI003EB86D7C